MYSMLLCWGLNPVSRLGHGKGLNSKSSHTIQKRNIKGCLFLESNVKQRLHGMDGTNLDIYFPQPRST